MHFQSPRRRGDTAQTPEAALRLLRLERSADVLPALLAEIVALGYTRAAAFEIDAQGSEMLPRGPKSWLAPELAQLIGALRGSEGPAASVLRANRSAIIQLPGHRFSLGIHPMLYASGRLCCQVDGNGKRDLEGQREARRDALQPGCDICGAPGYAIAVVVELRRDRPDAVSAALTDLVGLANHHLTRLAKAEHHYKRVVELQAALLARSAAETATRVEEEISMRAQGQSIQSKAQVERRMLQIEKFASAGRLAATIAHEVNNPMEAIKNAVYLLAGVIPESSLPVYNILKSETERVARVVRQMLGLYRDTEPVKPMSVNTIIEDTLLLLGHQLQKSDIHVEAEPGVLPDAFIAADQIRQVFTNLVINARDAMPRGGTLRIRSRHVIGRNPASSWIRILVADTGTGIPRELIADIFEPFVTTKGSGGTGLGLWIVKGIIQNHAGKITVRSKVGKGTVFRIDLPIAKP